MYQKRQISLPLGYKTSRPNTEDWERLWRHFRTSNFAKKQISPTFAYFLIIKALLYQFLADWLAHNKKMTEKSVFGELEVLKWRHNHSQCPVFGLAVLYSTGSEIWLFWNICTGKENCYRKFFFAIQMYISVHWGDLIEQLINICHIHFKAKTFGFLAELRRP